MTERPDINIHRQTAFGDDGQLEVTETNVETSLEDFGADVDHRERDSRLDRPEASEFGVDDRPAVQQESESDQSKLRRDSRGPTDTHRRRCEFAVSVRRITDNPPLLSTSGSAQSVLSFPASLLSTGLHRVCQPSGEFIFFRDGWRKP